MFIHKATPPFIWCQKWLSKCHYVSINQSICQSVSQSVSQSLNQYEPDIAILSYTRCTRCPTAAEEKSFQTYMHMHTHALTLTNTQTHMQTSHRRLRRWKSIMYKGS